MDLSLRARYGVALLLTVLAMAGVFVAAMGLFIEMVEYKLKHDTLARELEEQRVLLVRDPTWPRPSGGDVRSIVVDEASLGGIAPALVEMPSGAEQEMELDGRTYMVGRTDVGDRRLYVLLDIEPVERIERRLVLLAAVTTTAAAVLALMLGSALGRRALDPVLRLARDVERLDPERPGPSPASTNDCPELRPISRAIEQYQERLQQRLARERTSAAEAIRELDMRLVKLRSSSEHLSAQTDLSAAVREHVETVQHSAERMQLAVDSLAAQALNTGPGTTEGSTGPVAADAHPSAET
jgi:methyl-accepting chemotaxis protein